jgi:hypothetical protein
MNEFSRHPFEIAFDSLLFLRQHSQAYPDDVTAKFVQYCAANFMHCNSQLLQDALSYFFSPENGMVSLSSLEQPTAKI